ncbi:MAG: polysaccharide biosynthesis tyrosine autokinase [bacterium]
MQDFTPSDARIAKIAPETLIVHKVMAIEENHRVSDEFRLLRTRIMQRLNKQGIIMVTGFDSGDGKSTIALNLAVTFAKDRNHTTLLVDLNLRKPAIHEILELGSEAIGLSSYFCGEKTVEELFINPGIHNLRILLAGNSISQAPELLGSPRMKALVEELKERYKNCFIIFDVPSICLYPDPLILSEYVDGILFVARWGKIPRENVKSATNMLPQEKFLGIVLNGG